MQTIYLFYIQVKVVQQEGSLLLLYSCPLLYFRMRNCIVHSPDKTELKLVYCSTDHNLMQFY